ncbi:MAG: hypothetical protein WCG45_03575 [bacterium]
MLLLWTQNYNYLNKSLHVGHLRQLALAKSLNELLNFSANRSEQWDVKEETVASSGNAQFVALLGASLGVFDYAQKELNEWFDFLNYHPTIYHDVLMPQDQHIVPRKKKNVKEKDSEQESEVEVWKGPKGEVIVVRSNGKPTYSFYDISFANKVSPTNYITGVEQKEHFENLGLGEKHLPMGLVLGKDNKKIKSRNGEAATAKEIFEEIQNKIKETKCDKKILSWNIICWNLLRSNRTQNIKFDIEESTKPESPGMYITYTYARCLSALSGENHNSIYDPDIKKAQHENFEKHNYWTGYIVSEKWQEDAKNWSRKHPMPMIDMSQEDAELIGFAEQSNFYRQKSIEALDPSLLANFTNELAKKLNGHYQKYKIKDGKYGLKFAFANSVAHLRRCMLDLGMFCPTEV